MSETKQDGGGPVTVFYDGSCPLCSTEIGAYQRCRGAERVDFVDISTAPAGDIAPGLSREAAIARFHVRDASGRIVSGGRAFTALWMALPGLALFGRIFGAWPLSVLVEGAYRVFLPVRPALQRIFARRRR